MIFLNINDFSSKSDKQIVKKLQECNWAFDGRMRDEYIDNESNILVISGI